MNKLRYVKPKIRVVETEFDLDSDGNIVINENINLARRLLRLEDVYESIARFIYPNDPEKWFV